MYIARWTPGVLLFATAGAALSVALGGSGVVQAARDDVAADALALIKEGRETFRHATLGDEALRGGELGLHEAIAGRRLGGVGQGLSPADALGILGLKVDVEALPSGALESLRAGKINLEDPAATLELLRMEAVVGVQGVFDEAGGLTSIGITCALCHSTVDDSLFDGVGRRLDGWANRDLDVGALVALAPDLSPFSELLGLPEDDVRAELGSWGPGKLDAELILDGLAVQPDGTTTATLIPPAFGLAGVNLHTWTGRGGVAHWNAFVSPKLPALHFYQLALRAPEPPEGSFDADAADRGRELFLGRAQCATCHVPPTFSEPGWNLRLPEDGTGAFQAEPSPDGRGRTTPLQGLWTHQTGGFYHDGRFATLDEVVAHYDALLGLGLAPAEEDALVQYLLSL